MCLGARKPVGAARWFKEYRPEITGVYAHAIFCSGLFDFHIDGTGYGMEKRNPNVGISLVTSEIAALKSWRAMRFLVAFDDWDLG